MVKHREIQAHKVAPKVKVKVKIGLRIQIAIAEPRLPPVEVAILTASLRIPINGKRKHKG